MSQAEWVLYFGDFKISETVVVSWIIILGLTVASILLTRIYKKYLLQKADIFGIHSK